MLKLELDLDLLNQYAVITLGILLLLYMSFDVNYFLRLASTLIYGFYFQKPLHIFDTCTIYGICSTTDLDFVLKHMNNARYVREMDFARILFYLRSGLQPTISKMIVGSDGGILQTASTIRYRKTLPLYTTYKITTKLIYWDENAFYLEQQLISLKDGFTHAVVLSQQKLTKVTADLVMEKLLDDDSPVKPEPPEELLAWIEFLKVSSQRLRTIKGD